MSDLVTLIILGLATAAVSVTISKTKVTERFRKWLWTFPSMQTVAYLFDCPYCVSHWIAVVFVLATFQWPGFIPFLIICGATIAISAFSIGGIMKLMGWDQLELDYLRDELAEARETIDKLTT